jgi:hypothetical protein
MRAPHLRGAPSLLPLPDSSPHHVRLRSRAELHFVNDVGPPVGKLWTFGNKTKSFNGDWVVVTAWQTTDALMKGTLARSGTLMCSVTNNVDAIFVTNYIMVTIGCMGFN